MPREFKLPDLGEGIHEAEIVDILIKEGDEVKEDQPILRVETDKATVDVPSPFSGKILQIPVKVDQRVQVGDVLVVFSNGEAEAPAEAGAVAAPPPQAQRVSKPATPAEEAITTAPEAAPPGGARPQPQQVQQPPQKEAAAPAPAPTPPPTTQRPAFAAPATRRLAREMGVDLQQVQGTGPGGRVIEDDVRAAAEKKKAAAPAQPQAAPPPQATPPPPAQPAPATAGESMRPVPSVAPPLPDFGQWGPVERVPMRSTRRAIARHMALAWSQIPHVSHQDWADITELEAMRHRLAPEVEKRGAKLTLTAFALKAAVIALKMYPKFNSTLDPDKEEIILKHYYHIGVATDTDRGLLVPVIRDVDKKSLIDLAVELFQLAERTRRGEASLEEMRGGTFTITNIGSIGGVSFFPIVNYPEVAIMGLTRARLQAVARPTGQETTFVPRLMLPVILAFDHRVVDGAEAARFVRVVVEALEDPGKMLLMV